MARWERVAFWRGGAVRRGRAGATMPLVALSMVALLGMSATAIDGGLLYVQHRQMQNMADAAALAGVRLLPDDTVGALLAAQQYAVANGAKLTEIEEIAVQAVFNGSDSLRVVLNRPVALALAPVLGKTAQTVRAKAVALTAQAEPTDIWPWGITKDTLSGPGDKVLKLGGGHGVKGNYYALSFPNGRGASTYESNIKNGYNDSVPATVPPGSWWIDTETGNIAGPTIDGAEYLLDQPACAILSPDVRCPRIGVVPILNLNSWEDLGGRSEVEIIDFAVMEIVGLTPGSSGKREVIGRFLTFAKVGARPNAARLGEPLKNLLGVRLWQ